MEKKKMYEQPSISVVTMESEMMTTLSGQHNSGGNNGPVGDAKGNKLFFDGATDKPCGDCLGC
jgi:hypothetical protein